MEHLIKTPIKAPLPCYGLELNPLDSRCQKCNHYDDCLELMGTRANKVTLDKVKFNIMPDNFQLQNLEMDDPELPQLQRIYAECFYSVFEKNPTDNISQYRSEIAQSARKSQCSVRLFIISNMVAHKIHEAQVVINTQKLRQATFKCSLLSGKLAITRAETYQKMCHDEFGTFNLTSLAILTEDDKKDDLEETMLLSEVTAAVHYIRYILFNSGDSKKALYDAVELQLAPLWLAIEETYKDVVLNPWIKKEITGTALVQNHRYNVVQVIGSFKRKTNSQRIMFLARQKALPRAVMRVTNQFNIKLDDFVYDNKPVTDPMRFWTKLAYAIKQYHCWRLINGKSSFYNVRLKEELIPNFTEA